MNFKAIGILGAFALTIFTPFATTALANDRGNEPAIDYAKINETIKALLAGVAVGDEIVSKVEMTIDPVFTDVLNDKLKLELATELRKTSWSTAPTRFATVLRGEAKIVGPAEAQVLEAKIGAQINVETEAVPMLRNLATLAREYSGCARVRGSETGKKFLCDRLAELAQAADLEAVGALLVGVQRGMLQLVEEDLVRLRAELAAAETPEDRARLEKQIASEETAKAFVSALRLVAETGADGHVTGLFVDTGSALAFSENISLEAAAIGLTAAKLSFGADLFIRELTTAESYAELKKNIVDLFRKVEAGDAGALETVKTYAATYMSIIKGYTNP